MDNECRRKETLSASEYPTFEEFKEKCKKNYESEEEEKKRDSSSSNSRKGHKESRRSRRSSSFTLTSFEERERSKAHRNYSSGVESDGDPFGSVGSIELESQALA